MRYAKNLTFSFVLLSSACANLPDMTIGYYLPKMELDLTVLQTATCTTNNVPVVQSDITIKPIFGRHIPRNQS